VRRSRARHSSRSQSPIRPVARARYGADQADAADPFPQRVGPRRYSIRRALRLIATAGTAAGGMCLVLAMVAWVATRGAPGAEHATGKASPNDRLLIGRTLAIYRGAGSPDRGHFQIGRPGEWGVAWAFICPAGQRGTFVLADSDDDADTRERVDTAGPAGHGVYWNISDPGDHSLVITSSCPWTARVVLPRLPAGHQGTGSHPGRTIARDHRHKTARHGPKAKHPKKARHPKGEHPKKADHGQQAASRPGPDLSRRSAGSSGSA
jgi:hypothetical protein